MLWNVLLYRYVESADYHFIQCFVTCLKVASSATRMPRVPTSPLATVTRWKTRAVTRARITSLTLPLVSLTDIHVIYNFPYLYIVLIVLSSWPKLNWKARGHCVCFILVEYFLMILISGVCSFKSLSKTFILFSI